MIESKWEEELFFQIKAIKLPIPIREYKILPDRRWRADFVWPDYHLMVEVEGGVFSAGRHTRGTGYVNDCEKYNCATLEGYKILRVTPCQIKSGKALQWIENALKQGI